MAAAAAGAAAAPLPEESTPSTRIFKIADEITKLRGDQIRDLTTLGFDRATAIAKAAAMDDNPDQHATSDVPLLQACARRAREIAELANCLKELRVAHAERLDRFAAEIWEPLDRTEIGTLPTRAGATVSLDLPASIPRSALT